MCVIVKTIFKYLSAIIGLVFVAPMWAALTDSEGMPIVYLRGEMGNTGWNPDNSYRFTRQGNTYVLEIGEDNPVPEGSFKIGDEDWNFDFGADNNDLYIDSSCQVTLKRRGANIHTHGIYEGVISFEMAYDDILPVNFTILSSASDPARRLSGTLPVLYINVYGDQTHNYFNNEILDYNLGHKDYFTEAEYWLDTNGCTWMEELGATSLGDEDAPLPLQIKARGNWTMKGFSKKPFKIKLDKKQNLLGITPEKSKHYALLAHADDTYGYMRNYTAFNLGERIGLPWTPRVQPVELVINGDYRGLYFLTESVRVGDGRIEIEELDDNVSDSELISGGYVVELDNYDEENQIRMDEKSCAQWQYLDRLRITWDTPEEYSELQKRFVTDQFSAMNDAIGSNNDRTWSYLDLDDAARYYLVQEIVSHTEAFHGSTYLYRDRGEGEKWHFSPLWDAGNAFSGSSTEFFYNCDPYGNTWIPSFRENRKFNEKVIDTWLWFMQNRYDGIESDLDLYVSRLKEAAKSDRARWRDAGHPHDGQDVADNTDMESKLWQVKEKLKSKIDYLKKIFGDYTKGVHSEPSRDTTLAAALPDYAKSGVEEIFEEAGNYPVEFYTMQGVKVSHPQKGEIYIMRKGKKTVKIIF